MEMAQPATSILRGPAASPARRRAAALLGLLLLAAAAPSVGGFAAHPPTPARGSRLGAAKSAEEDLELTRQIILGHHRDTAAPSGGGSGRATAAPGDRPANDLMIRAAFGEPVERTPVWLFRQAGRHLPEYRAYKEARGQNFLELLADPAAVAECTLQPLRRYPLDAAILFSDILVLLQALGVPVTMPGGVGIQVPEPLADPAAADARLAVTSADDITPAFVADKLGHVLEAVRRIRRAMAEEGLTAPLIGFSAAPYTLLYYMAGGSSKRNTSVGKDWLTQDPAASRRLLDLLTKLVIEYMSAQVAAGCHMLQVFEAMGMMIDDALFEAFALPSLAAIGAELRARHPEVPLMVFCRGACQMNDRVAALGCFQVVTMDGSVDRGAARAAVGPDVCLQGGFDPAELIAENGRTEDSVRAAAREYLQVLGTQKLIANLGEGLGGKESTDLVDAFVRAIHEESEQMIQADGAPQ